MNPHDPMIEANDPRLTDYVLGELAPNEVAEIEDALKSSPELRAAVSDIRAATETIANVFQTEPSLQLSPEQKTELLVEAESANTDVHLLADNVTPRVTGEHDHRSSGATAHWIKIAVAASLAGLLLGGAYYFTEPNRPVAVSDNVTFDSTAKQPQSLNEGRDDDEAQEKVLKELPTEKPADEKPDNRFDAFADRTRPAVAQAKKDKKSKPKKPTDFSAKTTRKGVASTKSMDSFSVIRDAELSTKKKARPPAGPMAPINKAFGIEAPAAGQAFAKEQSAALQEEKLNAPSNSPLQLQAQQSLDRSTLRWLNLKVIAQNTPNRSRQSIDGINGVATGDQPTVIAKQSKNAPAFLLSAPTTFKLQISDQAAKQMVQLLANQADPLHQRKLSFAELIGLQPSLLAQNRAAAGGRQHDVDDIEFESDSTAYHADKIQTKSVAPAKPSAKNSQNAAASMLASKLREHIKQPHYRYNAAPASLGFNTGVIEGSPADWIAGGTVMPSSARPANPKSVGNDSSKIPPETQPRFLTSEPNQRLRSNEFNFDYTQVIQQLKSNLETRNKSVPPPKQ